MITAKNRLLRLSLTKDAIEEFYDYIRFYESDTFSADLEEFSNSIETERIIDFIMSRIIKESYLNIDGVQLHDLIEDYNEFSSNLIQPKD